MDSVLSGLATTAEIRTRVSARPIMDAAMVGSSSMVRPLITATAAAALAGFGRQAPLDTHGLPPPSTASPVTTMPRPQPVLLYEEALTVASRDAIEAAGAQKYFIIYQNNVDPGAQKLGAIDASALGRGIVDSRGDTPEGWGVLDFEDPFFAIIQDGPSNPRFAKAVESMVQALRSVKRAFPHVKWTFYGLPLLRYYVDGKAWAALTPEERARETDRQLAAVDQILAESDWLSPSIYNMVGDAKGSLVANDEIRNCTREWAEALTSMSVRYAKTRPVPPKVIPFVSPLYMPGGGARTGSIIPPGVFMEDTIEPAVRGGANGLCFWMGAGHLIRLAASDTRQPEVAGIISNLAEDWKLPREALEGANGSLRLSDRFGEAQAAAVLLARSRWQSVPSTARAQPR